MFSDTLVINVVVIVVVVFTGTLLSLYVPFTVPDVSFLISVR